MSKVMGTLDGAEKLANSYIYSMKKGSAIYQQVALCKSNFTCESGVYTIR